MNRKNKTMTVATTTEATTTTTTETTMSMKEFITRLSIYFVIGGLVPFAFLVWKFNLFTKIDSITIGIWGLVAIIFVIVFIRKMVKQIRVGLDYSMFTQTLDLISHVLLPLLIAIFCVKFVGDQKDAVLSFLIVVFICCIPAGLVNPLPRWQYEHHIEKDTMTMKAIIQEFIKKSK